MTDSDPIDPRPCERCGRTVVDHIRAELDGLVGHGWIPAEVPDTPVPQPQDHRRL